MLNRARQAYGVTAGINRLGSALNAGGGDKTHLDAGNAVSDHPRRALAAFWRAGSLPLISGDHVADDPPNLKQIFCRGEATDTMPNRLTTIRGGQRSGITNFVDYDAIAWRSSACTAGRAGDQVAG